MNFKSILIFLLGAVTGSGTTYLVMKKHEDKMIEKRVTKAILKEESTKKQGIVEEPAEVENPEKEEIVEEEKDEPDLTIYKQVLEKKDYTKAATSEKVTTMTDVIEEETDKLVKKAKKTKVPKKVTQDEFDSTAESERMTLYFYADGVLADDEDNVYDPVETMGATNFKNFKSTYDTVYIFNYATSMMYEVMPSNSKYSDIVGGDFNR